MSTAAAAPAPARAPAPGAAAAAGPWSPAAVLARTAAREARERRIDARLVGALVITMIVTQRIGITIGEAQISVSIPLAYAFTAVMVHRRRLVVSRVRAELLALAAAACLAVTAAVDARGHLYSLPSLLLLLVIYAPWLLRARAGAGADLVSAAARVLVRVMLVASAVGVAQLAGQLLGVWSWTDYLGRVVPGQLVISGYNTVNELSYGAGTVKANAFVFLEPSILSQLAALAVLVGIVLRVRAWQLLLLLGGLASAVSGTGIILLVVGVAVLAARAPQRVRPGHVVALVVAAGAAAVSPVGSALLARRDEFTQPGSSGYARFVEPYAAALSGLEAHPVRYLLGAGPGTASTLLPGKHNGLGNDVLYSVVPKLVFEYGLVAGGLVAVFLVAATLDGAPWTVVPGVMVFMTFTLSGALLQPETAYLVWVLAGIGATERTRVGRTRALLRRRR